MSTSTSPEETKSTTAAPPETPAAPAKTSATAPRKPIGWKKIVLFHVIGIPLLVFGVLKIIHAINTESTDDAYVNSYVTFVAPRVSGQVAKVLVDDNYRVKKGDTLVELDPEPYQVQLAIKQAAVEAAQADLNVAQATVRAQVAQARSARFKLVRSIEDVDNQVALLRARAATLDQNKASLTFAEQEFERAKKLIATKVTSNEEFDQKRAALDVARAQVQQALESVYQTRVSLGLPAQPPDGKPLTDVPPELDQTFSAVREALAGLLESAAQVGIYASSYNLSPKEVVEEFYKRDPKGDLDRIYAAVIKSAPGIKKAETSLLQAQRDLDQAKLNLRYCTVVAEIDGVVTRRNVNPGNNVVVGQSLMAIRSLTDIWIDANFKETQLRDLRIGQRVDLEADMYGGKKRFEGRISGFTEGTGSTLSLLPAENATGNFVKVVQRLPVRVDVVNYDPDKIPLFVGLSVTPTVDLKSTPTGPNAGNFLQTRLPSAATAQP